MPDPALIREEQELIPGGDIRIKGNGWLRKAWSKCGSSRVPREAEFRKLVGHLAHHHSLCILVSTIVHGIQHIIGQLLKP